MRDGTQTNMYLYMTQENKHENKNKGNTTKDERKREEKLKNDISAFNRKKNKKEKSSRLPKETDPSATSLGYRKSTLR